MTAIRARGAAGLKPLEDGMSTRSGARRCRRFVLACLLVLPLSGAAAQGREVAAPTRTPASEATLRDVIHAVKMAAERAALRRNEPEVWNTLDSLATDFDARGLGDVNLRQMAEAIVLQKPTYRTILRWDPASVSEMRIGALDDRAREGLLLLLRITNGVIEPDLRAQGVAKAERDSLLVLPARYGTVIRELAQAATAERLRRYEARYGEGSPQLNLAEALLNYWAQRLPGFGPGRDGNPGSLEFIASYRPAELAFRREPDRRSVVSAAQLGLRRYHYGPTWGRGSALRQLAKPRHGSIGLLLTGPADAPLQRAWGDDSRLGAFLGWGALHAGHTFGDGQRFVFGTDKLILPHLF